MKYNQPYGVADEVVIFDHPYVNGDPSIGRQGSIPPAESIEYDQREIVKVIQWAADNKYVDMNGAPCVAPTNSLLDQLLKALFGIFNAKLLRANAISYVNGSTGNDTTLDGTTASVSGSHGPFATIDRALTEMSKYNLGGFNYNILVADGTYTKSGTITLPLPNGSGTVLITGNTTTPANCLLHNSGSGSTVQQFNGGNYILDGFKLTNTTPLVGNGNACADTLSGNLTIGAINCGTSGAGNHLSGRVNGFCFIVGPITISGNASGSHMLANEGGRCMNNVGSGGLVALTISSSVSIGIFASASLLAYCRPIYLSITNPGNVTGTKYSVNYNSVMNVNGGGASYLPGTVAGSVGTGGVYA